MFNLAESLRLAVPTVVEGDLWHRHGYIEGVSGVEIRYAGGDTDIVAVLAGAVRPTAFVDHAGRVWLLAAGSATSGGVAEVLVQADAPKGKRAPSAHLVDVASAVRAVLADAYGLDVVPGDTVPAETDDAADA